MTLQAREEDIRTDTSEHESTLFRRHRDPSTRRLIALLASSGLVAAALLTASYLVSRGGAPFGLGPERWLDLVALAVVAAIGPYGIRAYLKMRRVQRLESRFPDFLRDVAVARRAGLTLVTSVQVAARGDYGELNPEIRRMAEQLSWNVTFNEALRGFGDRVRTPLIERSISLIEEASRSGGSVTDVILAASRDARETQTLEEERRMTMGLYVAVIYITFLVFLGVVAVMQSSFIPEVLSAGEAASGVSAGVSGLGFSGVTLVQYRTFYFAAALAQGIGNGIVAGIIETGHVSAGLRHSVAMALIAWFVFGFLI